jgi:hypothetical protein
MDINRISGLAAVLVLFVLSFLGSCTRPAKETVLIPDDFEGEFRIIYGEKCGLNPKMEKGRRVLEIPQNGLLIIQPEFEEGIIDRQYYFLDSDFNRAKINQLVNYEERKTRAPGVLTGGSDLRWQFTLLTSPFSIQTQQPLMNEKGIRFINDLTP